jgi:ATP-binding protein involved in chromosome partitioning
MESSTALESLRQRLEQLPDPDLGRTLGELSAVHSLQLRDGRVELYLELIPPLQWVAWRIEQSCRAVVEQVLPGAELELYVREKEVPRPLPSPVLPGVTNLIAVASGKGGVGKSTVAANIAVMLAQSGARVGLLDADIYGPSAPVLFGLQDAPLAARKDEQGRVIGIPHERFGIRIASMGFVMQRDQAAILRGPLLAGYFMTLVEQMDWGELDFLVFDLPPGTGDIQLTMAQRVPLTGVVLVTTPHELALADLRRSATMFRRVNVALLGVVENMSFLRCPNCGHVEHPFGEGGGARLAQELGIPFLGELPLDGLLQRAADEGIPAALHPAGAHVREYFEPLVERLVLQVRRINAERVQTPPLELSL